MRQEEKEECLYFSLVGTTPLAVANSLSWFLRMKPEFLIKEVFFICSEKDSAIGVEGTRKNIPKIKKILQENARKLGVVEFDRIEFNREPVLIPEADLPRAASIIAKAILSQLAYTTILDITAGRKLMSSASVIAGLYLDRFREREIYFYYYWLIPYTRDKIKKRAYELGLDDVGLILFKVRDILLNLNHLKESPDVIDQ